MTGFAEIKESLLHLFFPQVCQGCGNDLPAGESVLCIRCINDLPLTHFEKHAANPVEKIFWGRLPLVHGTAQYYFSKESLIQHLMHEFKYRGNKDLGRQLGTMMGEQLLQTNRFDVDVLIPLPLFLAKERKRGYNQATILCEGMAACMHLPVMDKAILRSEHTETQTKKGRLERWKNMEGKFWLKDPDTIRNKHILLVDDVVTTGATLEACGSELLRAENTRLSIATLCVASR